MRAGKLAQSLTQIDQAIQGANREIQQMKVFSQVMCYGFQRKIVAAGKNERGFLVFGTTSC